MCYEFCTDCSGTNDTCSGCITNPGIILNVTVCHCMVENGFYIKVDGVTGLNTCLPCHPLCKRCHGSTFNDCDECVVGVLNLDVFRPPTCNCIRGYFYDSTRSNVNNSCNICYEFCSKCITQPTNCQACIPNLGLSLVGSTCTCNAPGYFVYRNTTVNQDQCVRCNPLCLQCTGPLNTQCSQCDSTVGAIYKGSNTCSCVSHKYYDPLLQVCAVCNSLCLECTGPSSNECNGCNSGIGLSVSDKSTVCVRTCDDLFAYYKNGPTCYRILKSL